MLTSEEENGVKLELKRRITSANHRTSLFFSSPKPSLPHLPSLRASITAHSTSVRHPALPKQHLRWLASAPPSCPCAPSRLFAGTTSFPADSRRGILIRKPNNRTARQGAFLVTHWRGRFGKAYLDSDGFNLLVSVTCS